MALRVALVVFDYQTALLYRNGMFERKLAPGIYRFWNEKFWNSMFVDSHKWFVFDLRPLALNLAGQEILTKDKVPIRMTLAGTYRVVDPLLAQNQSDDWSQRLYVDVQLALRELVSGLTFDQALEQKSEFGEQIRAQAGPIAASYGVELQRVAVKDITMPANIRDMMLKAVEAEKSAQATLIKAREEVAAARSRANAAKLLAESPGAMRLKELETLVEISKTPGNTLVLTPNLEWAGPTNRS